LDKSDLVVLDIDYGLTSLEHAEAWAAANNIPETYIVSTGRDGGGFHFYFKGRRSLPDCVRNPRAGRVGFELNGVCGDIKHHDWISEARWSSYSVNGTIRPMKALVINRWKSG